PRLFARFTRIFILLAPVLGVLLVQFAHAIYPGRVMAFLQGAEADVAVTAAQYVEIEILRLAVLVAGLLCFVAAASFALGFDLPRNRIICTIIIFLSVGL